MSRNQLRSVFAVLFLLLSLTLSTLPAQARNRVHEGRAVAESGAREGLFIRIWEFLAGRWQDKEGVTIDPHGTPGGNATVVDEGMSIDPHG